MNDILVIGIYGFVGLIVTIVVVLLNATAATETVIEVLKEHGR